MEPAWLPAETAGLITGVVGGMLIAACSLFGGLSRWLAERGRGRGFVAAGFIGLGMVGLAALAVAAVAVIVGQPIFLWCPTAVIGGSVVAALALGLPGIAQRYRRARERRELSDIAQRLIAGRSSRLLARTDDTHRFR
jgi:hypothetical protein